MMLPLAAGFSCGVFLGVFRCKVLILVPATCLALIGSAIFAPRVFAEINAILITSISIQGGYACGLAVSHYVLPMLAAAFQTDHRLRFLWRNWL